MVKKSNKVTKLNLEHALDSLKSLNKLLIEYDFDEKSKATILWLSKRKIYKKFKGVKSISYLERVFEQNMKAFKNKYGPDMKWLRANDYSYKDIISMALDTGATYDVLSLNFKPLTCVTKSDRLK